MKCPSAQTAPNRTASLTSPGVQGSPVWSDSDLEPQPDDAGFGSITNKNKSVELFKPILNRDDNDDFSDSGFQRKINCVRGVWVPQDRPPVALFLHNGNRHPETDFCDIDPLTGALLPPIQQPPTYVNPCAGPPYERRGIHWRQLTMTSGKLIEDHLKRLNMLQAKADVATTQLEKKVEQVPIEEDSWPKTDCLLRPATHQDFAGIAEVVNAEMRQEHPQVFGNTLVGPQEIRNGFLKCQKDLRPFIVAVPAVPRVTEFLDQSKWPIGADKEFKEFVKFKKLQQSKQPSTNSNKILGFAFVTDSRTGLFGSECRGSRFTGRITVLVHPDHRGKMYGTALLDRILLSVAAYHRSAVRYDWECPDPMLIYEHPVTKNQRKYARLHIEGLFAGNSDAKEGWVTKMLKNFEFNEVGRLRKVAYTGSEGVGTWLDSVIWELDARPVTEITEEEPQRRICLN